jgi:hypothetical protein
MGKSKTSQDVIAVYHTLEGKSRITSITFHLDKRKKQNLKIGDAVGLIKEYGKETYFNVSSITPTTIEISREDEVP